MRSVLWRVETRRAACLGASQAGATQRHSADGQRLSSQRASHVLGSDVRRRAQLTGTASLPACLGNGSRRSGRSGRRPHVAQADRIGRSTGCECGARRESSARDGLQRPGIPARRGKQPAWRCP
ncbi:hypothetical protein CKY51_00925 [Xanthomonas maliensis]|nr:hypothetical protein CKY51_00925 [Xanthomonas maliensis]